MSEFIKLTKVCDGRTVWIRKNAITSVTENKGKTEVFILEATVWWEIKESPEFIMEQLEKDNER